MISATCELLQCHINIAEVTGGNQKKKHVYFIPEYELLCTQPGRGCPRPFHPHPNITEIKLTKI